MDTKVDKNKGRDMLENWNVKAENAKMQQVQFQIHFRNRKSELKGGWFMLRTYYLDGTFEKQSAQLVAYLDNLLKIEVSI